MLQDPDDLPAWFARLIAAKNEPWPWLDQIFQSVLEQSAQFMHAWSSSAEYSSAQVSRSFSSLISCK